MKKLVAERIRLLRLSNNLSQENIADELGISIGAYSNIERGVTDITVTRLSQLAQIFHVNLADLINEKATTGLINDPANEYGYASKDEVDRLVKSVETLARQIKEIRKQLNMK